MRHRNNNLTAPLHKHIYSFTQLKLNRLKPTEKTTSNK